MRRLDILITGCRLQIQQLTSLSTRQKNEVASMGASSGMHLQQHFMFIFTPLHGLFQFLHLFHTSNHKKYLSLTCVLMSFDSLQGLLSVHLYKLRLNGRQLCSSSPVSLIHQDANAQIFYH